MVCQLMIPRSLAVSTYGIIQFTDTSLKKVVVKEVFTEIFAALRRIAIASARVIKSFGRKLRRPSIVCQRTIPSSRAFSTKGIIHCHSAGIS